MLNDVAYREECVVYDFGCVVAGGYELGVGAFNVEVGRVPLVVFGVCCAEGAGVYFFGSWWEKWIGGEIGGVAVLVAGVTA